MVRKIDRTGEDLNWYRRCSAHARQSLGPKLMNRCRREKIDRKEHGEMLRRILALEEGRFLSKNARVFEH